MSPTRSERATHATRRSVAFGWLFAILLIRATAPRYAHGRAARHRRALLRRCRRRRCCRGGRCGSTLALTGRCRRRVAGGRRGESVVGPTGEQQEGDEDHDVPAPARRLDTF